MRFPSILIGLPLASFLLALSATVHAQDCEGFEVDFLGVGLGQEADIIVDLAYTPNGSALVVAHSETQNLTVLDESTGSLLRTIGLSGTPQAIAISPSGLFCAVSLIDANAVAVCRLSSGQEESVIPVGTNPATVRFDQAETKIVVGNTGEGSLSVIDFATRTEIRRVFGAGFFLSTNASAWARQETFSEFELLPDGNTALVPDLNAGRLAFLDLQGAPAAFVTVPKPFAVAISDDGFTAVTSPHFPETEVAVVDVPSRTLLNLRDTGLLPVFTPPIVMRGDASKVWIGTRTGIASINLLSGVPSTTLIQSDFVRRLGLTFDEAFVIVGSPEGHILDSVTGLVLAEVRDGSTPQRLAVSPNAFRAALVDPGTDDLIELWNTNGALATYDRAVPTGSPPEGDRAKRVAVSDDGTIACVLNNHSRNLSVVELPPPGMWTANAAPVVRDIVPVGVLPGEMALSPNGDYAVVTLFGEDLITIVDTAAPAAARRVQLTFAGGPIAISADSQTAYVTEFEDPAVSMGAGLWRIDLSGGQVVGPRLSTGEPGGGGYAFSQISSLVLSPDGNTLLSCNGSTDDVSVVDLTTWTEIARLTVGAYPMRAAFTPDGARAFVVSRNAQTLTEITLNPVGGGAPAVTGTTMLGFQPFEIVVHPSGQQAFVAAYGASAIDLIDLTSLTTTLGALSLPGAPSAQPLDLRMDASGQRLIALTRGGAVHLIDTATLAVEQSVELDTRPADLAWSDSQNAAVVVSPAGPDGLFVARALDECGTPFCFGDGGVAPGCTPCPCGNNAPQGSGGGCIGALNPGGASLSSFGRPRLTDESLRFEVDGLPGVTFALLLTGPTALPGSGACPPGSGLSPPTLDGLRCVGGGTQRLGSRQSDAMGRIGGTTPGWGPSGDLLRGSAVGATLNYQVFYRKNPTLGCLTGLNTTNAIRIVVRP